ncbi:MAG: hypothetical protein AAF551_04680 [Bacteroidota bacterium]
MKQFLVILLNLICQAVHCQYPFEKYPQPVYEEFKDWKLYDWSETTHTINHTLTIESFFQNEPLIIQLTSSTEDMWENSSIRIFRGQTQIQKLTEDMAFSTLNVFEPVRIADLTNDGLKDLKLLIPYLGNGIAALNTRVIYLIQNKNNEFTKISFNDKMSVHRSERDVDKDGTFEVITMKLDSYENHSYWTFNIFEFTKSGLINANEKDNYPIMIQYLFRENFEVTDKMSRSDMKSYALKQPEAYDCEK